MANTDFFTALEDLEKEKGIPKEVFLEALENALVSACKKQYFSSSAKVEVRLNEEKGKIEYFIVKEIVEEVEDKDLQISLADAQAVKKSYKLGDNFCQKFIPKDFTRIAAQTAAQVIKQKIHETERDAAMSKFSDKEGELLVGVVRKVDAKGVYVELGNGQIEGIMMPSDQVPTETYNVNDKIKVFVKRIKAGFKKTFILSFTL